MINAIHDIDEVCKNTRKESLFLFYLKCMNADVDACVRERKKKVLPDLKVVALVSLLCLMFSVFLTVVIFVNC